MTPEFHADDWFTLTGYGRVAVIKDHGYDEPWSLHEQCVTIDGERYIVRGVETNAIHHGHRNRPIGLLVEPW